MTLSNLYDDLWNLRPNITLDEIKELDVACKSTIKSFLTEDPTMEIPKVIKIQAVLDYMQDQINIGNWKLVPKYIRKTITISSYLKLIAFMNKSLDLSEELTEGTVKRMYLILDHGLLFGAPFDSEPQLLQKCAGLIDDLYRRENNDAPLPLPLDLSQPEPPIASDNFRLPKTLQIEVLSQPSMEKFYKDYILKETPVIIENCIDHWPALTKWKDYNYFMKVGGLRTVPVELGSKYTDANWTQALMTIGEFIKGHILSTDGTTGYLAQFHLFDHLPELREDIQVPEYCCFADSESPVDIQAWYGPKGTVSPLHYDAKRNLLAQAIGEKMVYLFSPSDSEFVYPLEGEILQNTSKLDPRDPDFNKYPKYTQATSYFGVLKAGQMLYIPPKWWHFIESLSVSFSVSFWWE